MYGGPMKVCPGDGCSNKIPYTEKLCSLCAEKAKKRAGSPFPDDPEYEQKQKLYDAFVEIAVIRYGQPVRFSKGECKQLADAWIDPGEAEWLLEQGCTPKLVLEIKL